MNRQQFRPTKPAEFATDSPLAPFVAALRRRGLPRLTARYYAIVVALDAAAELLGDVRSRHPVGHAGHPDDIDHDAANRAIWAAREAVLAAMESPVGDELRAAVTGKRPDWWPPRGRLRAVDPPAGRGRP